MARDSETTYRIMSAIKSKNTGPERILAKELWRLGLRYRKNFNITGKPDFAFPNVKLAVFVDGDFWHGHNWKIRKMASLEQELSSYNEFWKKKIIRNIERDREVNESLKKDGWSVVRLFESDIKRSPSECAKKVQAIYYQLKSSQP